MIRSLNFGGNAAKQISFGNSVTRPDARQRPAGERTDAVELGKPSAPAQGDTFALEKMRRAQARENTEAQDPMTRTFEAALKALPINEQGAIARESLFDFAGRATLDEALERYVAEGAGGKAEADLASVVTGKEVCFSDSYWHQLETTLESEMYENLWNAARCGATPSSPRPALSDCAISTACATRNPSTRV